MVINSVQNSLHSFTQKMVGRKIYKFERIEEYEDDSTENIRTFQNIPGNILHKVLKFSAA